MQKRVGHNNLLSSERVFHHSGHFLHPFPDTLNRKSHGIPSLVNSPGKKENSCDVEAGGEELTEDYDGNRNIFSISSGPPGSAGIRDKSTTNSF